VRDASAARTIRRAFYTACRSGIHSHGREFLTSTRRENGEATMPVHRRPAKAD
jgi:hypothetical protein